MKYFFLHGIWHVHLQITMAQNSIKVTVKDEVTKELLTGVTIQIKKVNLDQLLMKEDLQNLIILQME
jgi:hypothetical protein